jgi:hypothetical protein
MQQALLARVRYALLPLMLMAVVTPAVEAQTTPLQINCAGLIGGHPQPHATLRTTPPYLERRTTSVPLNMLVAEVQTGSGSEAENLYENLITKAQMHGSVRIIVRLKLDDWQPESALRDQQAIDAQRAAIARLQDRLLHSMAPFVVTNIMRFRFVPQMALTVDEAGLRTLISHPDVSTIWEDMTLSPGQ